MAQHRGNVAIVARFRAIEDRLELGRQKIVERRHAERPVAGWHRLADAPETDVAEEGEPDRTGRGSGRDGERIDLILKDRRICQERERGAQRRLVQRLAVLSSGSPRKKSKSTDTRWPT